MPVPMADSAKRSPALTNGCRSLAIVETIKMTEMVILLNFIDCLTLKTRQITTPAPEVKAKPGIEKEKNYKYIPLTTAPVKVPVFLFLADV